ncbi:MAG: redoxin domain-containing protein [Planctomycetes bacterium]|nr:redoxin domain-containing protein [Planctomycetota bacterium]
MNYAGAPALPTLEAAQAGKRFPAFDFPAKHDWLNTDKPVKLADLRGRIVLLDFWTLCCINCIHTLPDLAKLEAQYPGILVVIGVHSPKFENEKKTSSIHKAVLRYDIKHPVFNDIDHRMWRAYQVNAWPTLVLIDPNGNYYGSASGEGNLELVDLHIKKLIKEFAGKLKKDPIHFKLAKEKEVTPLYFPGKVLADPASKRIFIADSTNQRIVITNLEGKKIAIAGSGKEGLKDGTFAEAQFSDPQGMALDGDTLYVADRKNHSIRALDLKKETVKLIAGTGEQNRMGWRAAGGPALKLGLNSPWDLLIHKTKMYIAMAGSHQIWTYDLAKQRLDNYAGSGLEQIYDGPLRGFTLDNRVSAFAQPSGLATDGKQLFVADSETSSVRALPLVGIKGNVTTVVGSGLFEFGDKNGKGKQVRLQHALGIAYLDGKLYVADTYNSKIKLINPVTQTCETYLGDPPGWLKEKMFNEPGGVQIAGGKMYIADTNNHRIQIVDMKTKAISTLRLQGVDPVRRDAVASSKEKEKK